MTEHLLSIHDLYCGYGHKEIVHGVSLAMDEGEFACIIGANGCGKTTLLKNILCLEKPFAGDIRMQGRTVVSMTDQERARIFAYLPQAHTPPFPFTVGDVVLMGRSPYLDRFSRINKHDREIAWKAMRLLGMGVPVGLQFSITAIGSVILQSAVNSLGAVCVSGVAVAGKIYTLLACPFDALAMAATNFTGQNLGAGKYDRIKQGTYACMFIGILYCVLFVLIAQFGTRYLALLFMNADEAASVMDYTQQLSVAFAYATPLLLAVNVLRLSIQGMGYSRLSLISGLLEMLARTVVSLWAVPAFGFDAACLASPFAWLLADCFLIPAFYGCLNARRRQAARVRQELPSE